MASSTAETVRKCRFCSLEFTQSEHLNRHERRHTGEKPFQCEVCDKSYARSDVLARHMRGQHGQSTLSGPNTRKRRRSPSLGEMSPDQYEDETANNSTAQLTLAAGQAFQSQHTAVDQVSAMLAPDPAECNSHSVHPGSNLEFGAFDFGMEAQLEFSTFFGSTDDFSEYYSPQMLVDPGSMPLPLGNTANAVNNGLNSSVQPTTVQRVWPRRRAYAVVRRIRRLWQHAAQYSEDNIFSNTHFRADGRSQPAVQARWGMNEHCRQRLISDCDARLLPAEQNSGPATAPASPRISTPCVPKIEVEGLSPRATKHTFPSLETLIMSLDFYFRRFHPIMPFVHKATFDASMTPTSVLLPMCLIGLTMLSTGGAHDFVRQYVGRLTRFCRLDLTYKALGKGGTQQWLTSLASAMLVLYLSLNSDISVDEPQAHMLAIQTLFIGDRHGLFSASETPPPTPALFHTAGEERQIWTCWARIESVKRLVLCLISLDSAYTRMLDLAANIDLDRIEVVLPCPAALFEASTSVEFFAKVRAGLPLTMQQSALSSVSPTDSGNLTDFSVRVLLDVLALLEAAARHKLLSTSPDAASVGFVPAMVYARDGRASVIASTLSWIPQARPDLIADKSPSNALMWHYLCLTQCIDSDKTQTACGRIGIGPARLATGDIREWAKTAGARRAIMHAAQIFRLLSSFRLCDDKTLITEAVLSNAGMVLALYAYTSTEQLAGGFHMPLELLQPFDWNHIGGHGLGPPPPAHLPLVDNNSGDMSPTEQGRQFISQGGSVTFGGDGLRDGGPTARKLLLICAQLLDELSPKKASEYSRLLRAISDTFAEGS